jgi:DNA-binding NtrC family response regulator
MESQKKEHIRVLIADDEVEFTETLGVRLKIRGFETATVSSGLAALKAIEEDSPDVLVLDLKMPDLNGLEVLAKVKGDFPAIEVIILTGHGSFEAGKEGMEQGAFDYIMKPVDLNQLIGKIEEAYQKGKAA